MMSEHKGLMTIIKQVIFHVVEQEKNGWPPGCAGFYYQPKRPCTKKTQEMKEKLNGNKAYQNNSI